MGPARFASFAPDAEDVVLWRALHHVTDGRYVALSGTTPSAEALTRALGEQGWGGIVVASEANNPTAMVASLNHRLAEVGWPAHDIHVLAVGGVTDPGAVLGSVDLKAWRPWVVVVTSSEPRVDVGTPAWEQSLSDANYELRLAIGRSRLYVALERDADVGAELAIAANSTDDYTTPKERAALAALADATLAREAAEADVRRWQEVATKRWLELMEAGAFAGRQLSEERRTLDAEYEAIHDSVTWRVARQAQKVGKRFGAKPSAQ